MFTFNSYDMSSRHIPNTSLILINTWGDFLQQSHSLSVSELEMIREKMALLELHWSEV